MSVLLDARAREGNCDVPEGHVEGGVKLGAWLAKQRRALRRQKGAMRRQILEEVGVRWPDS